MKRYMVSLNASSRTLSLAEISRRMGTVPSPGSHEKGDEDYRGHFCFLVSLWRLDSDADDAATIEDHCRFLESRLSRRRRPRDDGGPADLEIWFSVGVMYDTYTASAILPPYLIALAHDLGAGIEVDCYPTCFNES